VRKQEKGKNDAIKKVRGRVKKIPVKYIKKKGIPSKEFPFS